MRALSTAFVLAAFVPLAAAAQTSPDDEWADPFPGGTTPIETPPQPPGDDTGFAPMPGIAPTAPVRVAPPPRAPVVQRPVKKEDPNEVSMLGALPLGQWKRGQAFLLGFPLLQVRASIGLTEALDVGLGFDSFYGAMNEVRVVGRYGLVGGSGWKLAAGLEGGVAFFTSRASREVRGARWLTGRRNYNLSPGLTVSHQGAHPRAARLFFDARVLVAFDTEPFASDPLSGVPPSLIVGTNLLFRGGAELPLSKSTAFLFQLGIDAHFRGDDAPVMPSASVGLITGI